MSETAQKSLAEELADSIMEFGCTCHSLLAVCEGCARNRAAKVAAIAEALNLAIAAIYQPAYHAGLNPHEVLAMAEARILALMSTPKSEP